MEVGTLISLIIITLTICSVILEHKRHEFIGMFTRDPNIWSITNLGLLIVSIILLFTLIINELIPIWNNQLF